MGRRYFDGIAETVIFCVLPVKRRSLSFRPSSPRCGRYAVDVLARASADADEGEEGKGEKGRERHTHNPE